MWNPDSAYWRTRPERWVPDSEYYVGVEWAQEPDCLVRPATRPAPRRRLRIDCFLQGQESCWTECTVVRARQVKTLRHAIGPIGLPLKLLCAHSTPTGCT